ncbi:hypothetical protein FNT36_18670 [Hymenobacter setariae]|uniref:DUF5723 domain-containing protein n=1 Tax=Hymenobacter setariae TaxID=2594794 RepID=A0A558BNY1_9BACT|nr:DUF5723 family protein [Hymenobacter setariae]TVT38226.1 hypothetical protein FNT36_18670 [Hymenobacter setariae]
MNYATFSPGACAGMLLLGLLAGQPVVAQGWLGLAQSNYGGTNAAYTNPSAIADSRHRAYLNLGGANANFYNTYLQLDLPQRPWAKGFEFRREYLSEQLTGDAKFGSASVEARLPSLMLAVGPHSAIALTNRVRAFVQVSRVSENLARLARHGLSDAESLGLGNRILTDDGFNVDANSFHEFAFTYARTFTPNTTHFFKGGLTVKYLVGLGGGYVHNTGTDYQVYGRDSIQLRNPNISYAYTGDDYYQQSGFGVGTLYGSQRLGRGYGADIGITYEWRPEYERYNYHMDGTNLPDDSRNKYRLRLSFALTDLGAVRYQHDQYVRQAALANNRTVQLGQLDTISFTNLATLTPTIERLVGLREQSHRFTSYLPATLRLTADYRLLNHVYAGLLWTQNLLPARTIGSRSISSLALTPRIEFSHLEVAVPVILANNYRKLQVGAMLRLGPLIFGSDNLGGLVGLTSATGADVYMGLGLALHRHRRKDRDGDLVSNKYDKCPREKGDWTRKGCPAPLPVTSLPEPALPPPASPAPALVSP